MAAQTDEQAAKTWVFRPGPGDIGEDRDVAASLLLQAFLAGCRHVREGDLRLAIEALNGAMQVYPKEMRGSLVEEALTRLRGADVK